MMKTTQRTRAKLAPLALHIRRLRQWCGEDHLSQRELAYLAGLCTRQLRSYESRRSLPRTFQVLLQLALALKVPVELLLDDHLLERLKKEVEGRCAKLHDRRKRLCTGYGRRG